MLITHPTRLRLIAAGFAVALLASACGDDGDGGGDDGTIELSFSWWGSDSRHAYTQELIAMFEAENPNINIEPTFTDFDAYFETISTSMTSGNAPDVMQMEERFTPEYVANDQLLDLNTVTDNLDTSNLDPAAITSGTIDGGLYTIPTGFNVHAVVADPQIVEDAGEEMPDDTTWTWEDYLALSVAISEAGDGDYFGAQAFGSNEAQFQIYARQRGEQLYNADGSLAFTAPNLAEFWQLAVDQTEQGGTPSAEETIEIGATGPDLSLLATNRGAFGWWWSNQLGAIAEASGRELVLLRPPGESPTPGQYLKPAMSWSISADTEHPAEAAQFVDFLLNSTEASELIKYDRGVPANTQVRDALTPQLEGADALVAEYMAEVQPTLAEPPPPPPQGAGEVADITARIYEEVLFGNLTPQEAAEQYMTEVEAAVGG